MARATYKLYPGFFGDDWDLGEGSFTMASGRRAIFTDAASGDQLIFEGKGLGHEGDVLAGGRLNKVTAVDAGGDVMFSLYGFDVDVSQLGVDTTAAQFSRLAQGVMDKGYRLIATQGDDEVASSNGDDIVEGRGGDDSLTGAKGDDILVGGDGNDVFVFAKGFDRDTIRDFDAQGGEGRQDLIRADFDEMGEISRSGRNTVIDFGQGDVLTLLNVRPGQIDASDFLVE